MFLKIMLNFYGYGRFGHSGASRPILTINPGNACPFNRAMGKVGGERGFTFIEIIVASLIMMLIVAAVLQYHATTGVSKGQQYYLKAVQTAHAEMDKLRVLYVLDPDGSEFADTGAPPADIFLFRFTDSTTIEVPSPLFRVYYGEHGSADEMLRSIGDNNGVKNYADYYATAFEAVGFEDTDTLDRKTFAYFTDDGNTVTDSNPGGAELDASMAVIDDMGSPTDPEDDLLGNMGWWVEDVALPDTVNLKKVTFAFQFWYPGQDRTKVDPEVIVLKTTLVKP